MCDEGRGFLPMHGCQMKTSLAPLLKETVYPDDVEEEPTLRHHDNFPKFLIKSQSHSYASGVFDEKALLPMSWELITCL